MNIRKQINTSNQRSDNGVRGRRNASRSAQFVNSAALVILLMLFGALAGHSQTTLVERGSEWRYLDIGVDPGPTWTSDSFDDSTWRAGSAQLGYGDGDEVTRVRYGLDYTNKFPTTYFRRTFNVDDPSAFAAVTLSLLRDDGAVVYVNGTEVFRTNMPSGPISYGTFASVAVAGSEENLFFEGAFPTGLLRQGVNVIAVEIHQSDVTSSDISFDLELIGSLTPSVVRGPYLQMGSSNSMTVRWRTNYAVPSIVYYGVSQGLLTMSASDSTPRTEHEIRIANLNPATKYFYGVGTDKGIVAGNDANHFFVTSPADGQAGSYRFWVLGDSGTMDAGAQTVRDSYMNFNGSRQTDLLLLLGDNAYWTGTDAEYQLALFNMYPEALRRTPVWSTLGNHDTGFLTDPPADLPYFQMFSFPTQGEIGGPASGTEKYYSFNYGNVHFVSLDSMASSRAPGSPMLQWLENDLASNTKPWVVVFFHHPPYSRGSHFSDDELEMTEMRANVVPILERFGVDLVLSGHSHSYERSYFIDGHYGLSYTFSETMKKNPGSGREDSADGPYRKSALSSLLPNEGTVYTVLGVSGQASGGSFDHPAMYQSGNPLGSLVIDVDTDRMDVKFLTATGAIGDYFTIRKGGAAPPPPPPPVTVPVAPSNLTFASIRRNSVVVTWQDNSNNEDGFEIQRCLGTRCSDFARVGITSANAVSFADSGLAAATNYSYRVRAFNSAGTSTFVRSAVKTLRR